MKNTTTKILTISVILLLLVNVAMLIFILKGHKRSDGKGPRGKGGPFEMLVKELNMSDQQQVDYKKLKEDHFNAVRPLFDSVRAAKQVFFGLAKDSILNDSLVNMYSNRIAMFQSEADKMILEHFRKVRGMFKDEQQRKFDEFVQKMMQGRKRDSAKGKPE
jgi:hypothetical protein